MPTITLEQALFHRPDRQAPQTVAHSPSFEVAWIAQAESLIYGFGDRPGVTRCPQSIFAKPLASRHVAIVRVVDSNLGAGFPIGLRFHFLVIDRKTYESWV